MGTGEWCGLIRLAACYVCDAFGHQADGRFFPCVQQEGGIGEFVAAWVRGQCFLLLECQCSFVQSVEAEALEAAMLLHGKK